MLFLQLTVVVIVSVVDPVATQSQQSQERPFIGATYESMLLGSSLGAFFEQESVSARVKDVLLPSVVCCLEGSRGRPSHARGGHCERPVRMRMRVRASEERREEEPEHKRVSDTTVSMQ